MATSYSSLTHQVMHCGPLPILLKTRLSDMPQKNGFVLPFVFLLVSTSAFSQKSPVFGSSVRGQSFRRPDPLNHFKLYKGGYNVTSIHYWASAAFTGIHGYAIAGIWMLCGMAYGFYMILKNSTSSSSSIDLEHSHFSYLTMFLLVVLFFILAIVATGIVIAANQVCSLRTKRLKESVVGVAGEARKTISNVTQAMDEMQSLLLPYDSKTSRLLNVTSRQLRKDSQSIRDFVHQHEHTIDRAIQTSYIVNLGVVTVNMAFLVAGLVMLLLHWHPGILIIIFSCWILTTVCWVLTGLDFFLLTYAKDTCSALEDFEQSPQNNSLSSVIPCANSSYSDKVLFEIGYTVYSSISQLNLKITEFSRLIRLDEENENPYVAQKICNPFSGAPNYSYAPENCPKEAIPIGDLPGVLSKFTCFQEYAGDCTRDGKFIPETSYIMARAYSIAIQDLINIFPDFKSLLQCSFVTISFSDIVLHQCTPYKASNRKLWVSVLCLSIVMVGVVLLLVAKAYQDRGRSLSVCSILPNSIV